MANVLAVAVAPAVLEELFFRYLALGVLFRACGVHAAVWVSAGMFALAHIYAPLGLPWLFVAGLVFGYFRVAGGVTLAVLLHFGHNLLVLCILGCGMSGQRVEAAGDSWAAPAVWTVLGAAAAALGVPAQSAAPAWFALLPWAVGLALAATRRPGLSVEVTAAGLEVEEPPRVVPFAEVSAVQFIGRGDQERAEQFVYHPEGVLRLPPRLNVRSDEFCRFLLSRLPRCGAGALPRALQAFRDEQVAKFGPDRVFEYHARPGSPPPNRRRNVTVGLAVAAAGGAWCALGIANPDRYGPFGFIGGIVAAFAVLVTVLLAFESRAPRHIRDWHKAALVVAPVGLALEQGDVRGKMRWDELKAVELYKKNASFQRADEAAARQAGLTLEVAGAAIVIADLYDRPLFQIAEQIRAYWQGPDAD